jgi:hypothetical protein
MSVKNLITCDICEQDFTQDSDVKIVDLRIEGPAVIQRVEELKDATTGAVLREAQETSYIDHTQDVVLQHACGGCYKALREFIKNGKVSLKKKALGR